MGVTDFKYLVNAYIFISYGFIPKIDDTIAVNTLKGKDYGSFSYRVPTQPGNLEKVCNFKIFFQSRENSGILVKITIKPGKGLEFSCENFNFTNLQILCFMFFSVLTPQIYQKYFWEITMKSFRKHKDIVFYRVS